MEKNNPFSSQHFYHTVVLVLILVGVAGIMFTVEHAFDLSKRVWRGDDTQVLNANGTVMVKAMPDIAYVSYTLRAEDPDDGKAALEVTRKLDSTIAALVAAGISRDDIYLSQYQVNKVSAVESEFIEMPQANSSVSQNITVEIEGNKEMLNKNLAELEKVAIQNDLIPSVNSNSHICLDFSDPVSVFSKGRHEAVQKAQEKAFDLASAGGLNLGKITSVTDNMYGFGGDNSPYSNYCSTNLGSGRVIEEQEVAVSVSVNFEIK